MERAFRLAGLLRLRELQEDHAAGALAVSHARLRAAEQRRGAGLDLLAGHALPGATDPTGWRASVTARGTLTHLLADATIDARDAGERVADDAAVWSAARSRSVGLEKLRDAHRTLVAVEDARAEQLALDEVAARRRPGPVPAPATSTGHRTAPPRAALPRTEPPRAARTGLPVTAPAVTAPTTEGHRA